MKYCILILGFIFSAKMVFAQGISAKRLTAMPRSYNNKIILRLFATDQTALSAGNKKGYIIQRADYAQGDQEKLNYGGSKNSFRLTEDSAQHYIENNKITDTTERRMAGLAFGLTDDRSITAKGDVLAEGMLSLKEQLQNEAMKFFMINMACNRSKLAAKVLGLWIEDEDVVLGKTYVYRIKINDQQNDWFYVKIKCENFNPDYLLNNRQINLSEDDSKIKFTFPEGFDFYAFNVDRSNFNVNQYKRLNTEPIVKITASNSAGKTDYTYGDSNLVNYKKYYYKVWVNTPFGDELLFADFSAIPRDKTPPPVPAVNSADHINSKQVEIKWSMEGKASTNLKGFNIKRSDNNEGPYTLISEHMLPANSRQYIDNFFVKGAQNYYVVEAVDTSGNISKSFPVYVTLIDSTPPAIPVVIRATIDSLGKIIIRIQPNTEKDFAGYQLLKANAADHEFSVEQETYKDSIGAVTFVLYDSTTLQSLTPNIYYKLIAFDTHYNQSEPSKTIILKRPDTIPPVSPIIKNFKIADSSVTLLFANSSSEDAAVNYLLRRETSKQQFDTVFFNRNIKTVNFTDKNIIGGKEYEYTMLAKDESGLMSKPSRSIIIKTILNNELPAPVLKGVYDEKAKSVQISFDTDDKLKGKKVKIEISRRENKSLSWSVVKIIDIDKVKIFTDDQVKGMKGMLYIARLSDENNRVSVFSKPLEIKF